MMATAHHGMKPMGASVEACHRSVPADRQSERVRLAGSLTKNQPANTAAGAVGWGISPAS